MQFELNNKCSDSQKVSTQNSYVQTSSNPFQQNNFAAHYIQPKLTVGAPNDIYEQEADATANKMMRMPDRNFIQRKCADCEKEDENKIQRKEINSITPFVQTKSESNFVVNDSVTNSINTTRGSGSTLNGETKSFMESRFCADFSGVNIHTGSDSIQMNRELNAQAFTAGSDIYFNEGKYQPQTDSGKHLLAHELTHVVQQNHSKTQNNVQRQAQPQSWRTRLSNAEFSIFPEDEKRRLVGEAIGTGFTVVQSTNMDTTVDAAIASGSYQAWDSATKKVNYDNNFNSKVSAPTQYGLSKFNRVGTASSFYIVLGPQSLKPEGPEYTQMANRHEQSHAQDFASQGTTPHAATTGEELRIYTDGFINFVIPLTVFDTAALTFNLGETFDGMFDNYVAPATTTADKDSAFTSIQNFVNGVSNANDQLKLKLWFQEMMNSRPVRHALIVRMKGLALYSSLTRGTSPASLLTSPPSP